LSRPVRLLAPKKDRTRRTIGLEHCKPEQDRQRQTIAVVVAAAAEFGYEAGRLGVRRIQRLGILGVKSDHDQQIGTGDACGRTKARGREIADSLCW
jgi:hypothetical protein